MPRRRLKTASDLRRYLANLINRVEQGETTLEMTSKLQRLNSEKYAFKNVLDAGDNGPVCVLAM